MEWITLGLWAALSTVCLAIDPKVNISATVPLTILIGRRRQAIIQVKRDKDVTMSCTAENVREGSDVRWKMEGLDAMGNKRVQELSIDVAATDNIKHHIEKPTDQTWMLRIRNVQLWDEGNYTCYVQLTTENRKFSTRQVQVFVPPYLDRQQTSADTALREAEETDLLCNATGRPYPTITWTRTGNALLPGGSEVYYGSVLPIKNARPDYRGDYMCRVENSMGSVEHIIHLDVQFKPIVQVGADKVHQKIGIPVVLVCYVEANPEPGEEDLKWVKSSLAYSQSSGRYVIRKLVGAFNRIAYELVIDPVEEQDYGRYECQVKNTLSKGTPTRGYISLEATDTAQPSPKLGRVLKVGELRSLYTLRSSATTLSTATTLITIATFTVIAAQSLL